MKLSSLIYEQILFAEWHYCIKTNPVFCEFGYKKVKMYKDAVDRICKRSKMKKIRKK